ncbi:MAG: DNA-3-methyladenine glycosylase I [Spirochaetaceae bacterium]|jgi:DNA-3-methyladenine glycosylase I|nr:DNA-3-methyladenine glycosylase I [Spirochaetaceae bacterium]
MNRCGWCEGSELYINYHDTEWGVPVFDDQKHFEFLVLESAQAGLSWLTVLKKRENYHRAYDGFDPQKAARYTEKKKEKLLADPGIIRNRLKIEASITNAREFLKIQREFGSFSRYIWGFTGHKPLTGRWKSSAELPTRIEETIHSALTIIPTKMYFPIKKDTFLYKLKIFCGI